MSGSLDILLFDNFIYLLILARDSWACQVTTTKSFQAFTVLLDLKLGLLVHMAGLVLPVPLYGDSPCTIILLIYSHSIP
jgi:hypothetical protein